MPQQFAIPNFSTLADGPPQNGWGQLAVIKRIRSFEDTLARLYMKGLIRGSTHLCQGQEATEVGFCEILGEHDTVSTTYRGHGPTIARGASLAACFAEILGRVSGLCRGLGGSMHLTDASLGLLGSNAIVGANLPISVGAALSAQQLDTGAVSVAFCGDGATNIGTFHEALNLAAVWKLPVVFVIENNLYGEYSPLHTTTAVTRLADRAMSYGIPGLQIDGNDLATVNDAARWTVNRARAGDGPSLVEALTYRHSGHSRSDPAAYRSAEELQAWLARDPIKLLEEALRDDEAAGAERIAALDAEIAAEVSEAARVAQDAPEPDTDVMMREVFA